MSLTPEQLDFIRQHGVTHCPPGPERTMYWGGRMRGRLQGGAFAFPEASEADLLRGLLAFDWRWPKGVRPDWNAKNGRR